MALTDGTLQALGNHLASLCPYASLHSADPGSTGTNATTAARQAVSFNVDGDGDLTLTSTVSFTGGAASGAVTHVGLWSASTGGTFRGGFALSGDTTFNGAGEYNLTGLTINATAS
jgi:hypothetical protein